MDTELGNKPGQNQINVLLLYILISQTDKLFKTFGLLYIISITIIFDKQFNVEREIKVVKEHCVFGAIKAKFFCDRPVLDKEPTVSKEAATNRNSDDAQWRSKVPKCWLNQQYFIEVRLKPMRL